MLSPCDGLVRGLVRGSLCGGLGRFHGYGFDDRLRGGRAVKRANAADEDRQEREGGDAEEDETPGQDGERDRGTFRRAEGRGVPRDIRLCLRCGKRLLFMK